MGRSENWVWDFLTLGTANENDAFTNNPHLTLGILPDTIDAMVTVPNAVNRAMRSRLIDLGESGFRQLTSQIVANLKPLLNEHPGATPRFRGVQRRHPSQRSTPFIDALIEFDLRTAVDSDDAPKSQPRWLAAGYNSFVNKEGSNYQIQMGVLFPYEYCPELSEPGAIEMIAKAWLYCKPLVDLAR
ncbi:MULTISPECIES: hypothetical protein [unclassified Hyphomicrobium]|uniref:hypothetical protein n=1 Tax=unclassified Hyphomicrobium TaxID=2619925 RepID=UPI000213F864|nr:MULTISPECIES: hypothetical protein [unclassified Hyphomicrobium]CCB63447.1 protein of unknown function [Hyphomicrobium sp. MC1]